MDGKKRIIPLGKMLKWRFGQAFLSKNLKMQSFKTNREKLQKWNKARVTGDRESIEWRAVNTRRFHHLARFNSMYERSQ
jgi:hypothetical protein